jgi:hypothetical protein
MIKRYLDFELKVYTDGKDIEIDIDGRPYGFSLPKRLKLPLLPQPINYKSLTPDRIAIAAAGHSLFTSLFPEDVKTAFAAYLGRRKESEGVRICISTQSNVLGEWVWEILCNELQPAINFLALDPKTPIIRITRVGQEMYDRPLQLPLRMLIVLASPGSLAKIDVTLIEEALRDAIDQRLIIADYLGFDDQAGANYDALQEKIARQATPYDVVHIIAHGLQEAGEEGQVAFTRPVDGGLQKVSASSLARLFRARGVMLVVLQSCQSGTVDPTVNSFSGVAQQMVASGVPAVLAMQDVVEQDVAADFIRKLYRQWISVGTRFEDALTQARQSLSQTYQEGIAPWAIPVFYIVPGLQLILHQPAPPIDIEKTVPPPAQTAVTERQVDAALPRQMRLGKETDLLVLIRMPSAPGLREKLGAELRDFEATAADVLTSSAFDVEFKRDTESGKPIPFVVKIRVDTKDFELDRTEVKVQIRPQGDSVLSIFSATAKKRGAAKMWVRVFDTSEEEVTLAEVLLRIDVRTGETFETEYLVTETVLKPLQPKRPPVGPGSKGGFGSGHTREETIATGGSASGTATGARSHHSRIVTGIFRDRESAECAYRALTNRGYSRDDVNLLMSDETRDKHFTSDGKETELGNKALEGAGMGAAIGGTVGATLAAISAIGTTLALPGLGLLVAGPIAAGLAGAGAGGATGGLIGALIGAGIPEERLKHYEKGLKEGGIVIGVYARSDEDAEYFENEFRSHRGEEVYR